MIGRLLTLSVFLAVILAAAFEQAVGVPILSLVLLVVLYRRLPFSYQAAAAVGAGLVIATLFTVSYLAGSLVVLLGWLVHTRIGERQYRGKRVLLFLVILQAIAFGVLAQISLQPSVLAWAALSAILGFVFLRTVMSPKTELSWKE